MYPLTAIYIYPIKSMGGIALQKANLRPRGIEYDRQFMLVDEEGKFMTQREMPKMALFTLQIHQYGFNVSYKKDSLDLPLHGEDWQKMAKKVQVWKSSVTALLAPKAINDWFSKHLEKECYLTYMATKTRRTVPPHYAGKGHTVSFADGYPMLLANKASLADLNAKMDIEVHMNRFRPNLVFAGQTAWEEDNWAGFSIGAADFKCAKACARCPIVNTNQETATRSPEVLKTMATFRRKGNKVLFGINLVWENFSAGSGTSIEVGQSLDFRRSI